jgi:hypothetical protein
MVWICGISFAQGMLETELIRSGLLAWSAGRHGTEEYALTRPETSIFKGRSLRATEKGISSL